MEVFELCTQRFACGSCIASRCYSLQHLVLLASLLGCSRNHVLGYFCSWPWLVCIYIPKISVFPSACLLHFLFVWCRDEFVILFLDSFNSGHGSFSESPLLNSFVGHILHSSILVPYNGWWAFLKILVTSIFFSLSLSLFFSLTFFQICLVQ